MRGESPGALLVPGSAVIPSEATVFVVDDDAAVRDSLRWLLESVGLRVQTYDSGQSFLAAFDPDQPGCLVLDVRMPGMSGLELQERLNHLDATLPVIIITGHSDVPMAVRAMKAGAFDFIEKPFSDQLLMDQVHGAIEQHVRRRAERSVQADLRRRIDTLSPREKTVMEMVVSGMSNKTIAAELGLSQKTVEVHRAHVMAKIEADSLADLVRYSLTAGVPAH